MNKTQIKQLNKKIDKLLRFKKLPAFEETGMPIELIKEAADTLKEDAKKVSPQESTVIAGQSYYFDQQNPIWGGWTDLVCTQLASFKPLNIIPNYSF